MKHLLLTLSLFTSFFVHSQITSVDAGGCLQSADTWAPAGNVGARNTYLTNAHNGNIPFRVIWVPGPNFWRIEADLDFDNSFSVPVYTNSFASSPNPPALGTGTWVDLLTGCGPLTQFTGPYTQSALTLPVKWGEVSAVANGSIVKLNWETLFEQNNQYFIVQRSPDGANFTDLGTVTSKALNGTSLGEQYEFIDANLQSGRHYYRIVQVDVDNKRSISEVVAVDITAQLRVSIYPNPAQHVLQIRGGTESRFNYTIVNSGGLVVLKGITLTRSIDITQLPRGIYVLRTETANLTFFKN